MSDKIIKELKKLQVQRKVEITRLREIYHLAQSCQDYPDDKVKLGSLNSRFKNLDKIYTDFNSCHGKIIGLLTTLEDTEESMAEEELVRSTFDDIFHSIGAIFWTLFPETNSPMPSSPVSIRQSQSHAHARLPKLSLPTFTGNIKEWRSFIDLYQVLVHKNSELSPVEKFQYLITSLTNEPLSIVRTVPLSAANYIIAYNALCNRYQNKRFQSSHYWNEIVNVPKVNSDNVQALRHLLDIFNENLNALKNLGFPVDEWDFIMFNLLVKKVDSQSVKRFELQLNPSNPSMDIPTYPELVTFLHKQCLALDSAAMTMTVPKVSYSGGASKNLETTKKYSSPGQRPGPTTLLAQGHSEKKVKSEIKACPLCNKNHNLDKCALFLNKSPNQRYAFLKNRGACVNCFGSHVARHCKNSWSCMLCDRRHNTLLHFEDQTDTSHKLEPSQDKSDSNSEYIDPLPVKSFTNIIPSKPVVLLSTARVRVMDVRGTYQTVRVLLDSASQSSFITEKCLRRLGIPRKQLNIPIYGLGEMASQSSGAASCTICPVGQIKPTFDVEVISVPKICSHIPEHNFAVEDLPYLSNLKLADDDFNKPGLIDILLGADIFPLVLQNGHIIGDKMQPSAINTVFGWVVMGKLSLLQNNIKTFFTSCEPPLNTVMEKFWKIEEVPSEHVISSEEDLLCEKIYSQTTYRDNGRFVVSLPFKGDYPHFKKSKEIALKRLYSLERNLIKNPSLYSSYAEFMKEYLDAGHMSLSHCNGTDPDGEFYIPHFCILKPESSTTKLRVVFDASAKDANGISLNETLLIGPKLQQDIFALLLSFRFHVIVFTSDIKQMYRQILVNKCHRQYQKILWRFSQNEPVEEYVLNTVTYGVASAPFLALRTILQIASEYHSKYPLASEVLQSDTFVDDLVTGCDSVDAAISLQSDLIKVLKGAGLHLHKWASNHPAILDAVPSSECQQDSLSFDSQDSIIKILGLRWLPNLDVFSYHCSPKPNQITKRGILSELARIFDPLGFVAPVAFLAKYLIQYLWIIGVDWDQAVPDEVSKRWTQFEKELPELRHLHIPRRVVAENYCSAEIHGFSDGSEKGFAAVVYFRFKHVQDKPSIFLVCAKSKVSPLKRISIPRLELCGAVLLSKLMFSVMNCYRSKLSFDRIYAWCDSMTALSWIKSSPHRWKTFVSNRVSQVQAKIQPEFWHYVASKENPADCASRGLLPVELMQHPLWWVGPSWLYMDPLSVDADATLTDCPEESKHLVLISRTSPSLILHLLLRFSSLAKIKRVIAYCLRFIANCRTSNERKTGGFDLLELNNALLKIVHHVQTEYFAEDIAKIHGKKSVTNQLRRLNPFIDESGILRVGGRLRKSNVSYSSKHPILLPRQSRLTELIIEDVHSNNFHPGFQTTHFLILQNFWILNPKRAIRSTIGKCYRCFRVNPISNAPPMADLPTFRVNQLKCFSHVCVDMGGPFFITPNRHRGVKTIKSYLCLFVCCSTKALHLELTTDLSSESFLAALRRFMSRRGRVVNIFSDCGTNFVGSSKYLSDIMQSACEAENIHWNFNPPAAPHFNGLAEAGIKSVKSHLSRVIGEQILTYEELNTVIVQVEGMLNSRPLSPVSSDPNDLMALTPGHFLILEPPSALPDFDLTTCKLNTLTRWQLLIRLTQDFWNRWKVEYLHTLSQRYKWNLTTNPPTEGMLVVLKDEQTPPLRWQLARITRLHPGSDGICRVVTVKTVRGIFQRPVIKVCPLPSQ